MFLSSFEMLKISEEDTSISFSSLLQSNLPFLEGFDTIFPLLTSAKTQRTEVDKILEFHPRC
jgi:hypothetical protein